MLPEVNATKNEQFHDYVTVDNNYYIFIVILFCIYYSR